MRIAIAVLMLAVMGCGPSEPDPTSWSKSAGQTTCADWMDRMDVYDRKGLALAMLKILWEGEGAGEMPGDDVAVTFANDIGAACGSYRSEMVSAVGSSLYPLDTTIHP